MKQFSDFNIKIVSKGFEGNKIKMAKLLDNEIIVHHYKIEDSKIYKGKGNDKCLHLQISINGEKRVVFTSGIELIEAIQKVPEEGFPFKTVIVEISDRLKFS
ncbi:MAG: hypothetical protein NTZ33_13985 [Bacteroidetes bacterium]|nr:hypothetical protein [Bacteroidota bacterium]